MKKLFLCFLLAVCSSSFAQADSILFWNNKNKADLRYELVVLENEATVIENYKFFKGRYWLISSEKLPKNYFFEIPKNKTNPRIYQKRHRCDASVNRMRNEPLYFNLVHTLEQHNRNCLPKWDEKIINGLCHEEYLRWEQRAEANAYVCIDSAAIVHYTRMNDMMGDTALLAEGFILGFISEDPAYFDPSDAKLLAFVIKNKISDFVKCAETLNETDFSGLCQKLENFPKDINTEELKAVLKNHPSKSAKKKQLVKMISSR